MKKRTPNTIACSSHLPSRYDGKLTSIAHLLVISLFFLSAIIAKPGFGADKGSALEKYKEGMEAIKQDNYPVALAAFEKSYELNAKPAMLYNIAMCHKALFQYVNAIGTFERYLREAGSSTNPAMRKDAQDAISELNKLVGKLRIDGAPDGSQVFVRGESVATTPLGAPLLLDPGQYPIRIVKKGFEPLETKVTIAAEAQSVVNADLQPEQVGPMQPQPVEPKPSIETTETQIATSNDANNKPSALFWTGLGGTIVTGAISGIFFGMTSARIGDRSTKNDELQALYESETWNDDAETTLISDINDLESDAEKYNKVAVAMAITSGVLAVSSIIILTIDLNKRDDSEKNISANLSPTGVAITGRF